MRRAGCRGVRRLVPDVVRVAVAIVLALACAAVQADAPIRVVFINPDRVGNPFWDALTGFMQAAARDLDMELVVLYSGGERFEASELAQKAVAGTPRPDYLVFSAQASEVGRILAAAEAAQVRTFTINTGILPEDRAKVGEPRERYRHWIGHMSPDDSKAGFDLAKALIGEAQSRMPGRAVEILGLSGSRDSAVAVDRHRGLQQAVAEAAGARVNQVVYSGWSPGEAFTRTTGLLKRYPQTTVLWSASDVMALAMARAASELGRKPGVDVLVGGMDWSDEALAAIERGELGASMGGHFMEGGWSMVLLHDYHRGRDFAAELGTSIRSEMQVLGRHNAASLRGILGDKDWDAVDFRRFSPVLTPSLRGYDFSLEAFVRARTAAPATGG